MKKLISLFVVAMMVLTCVVPVFAAEKVKAGETFDVTVSFDAEAKYATYAATVDVDETVVSIEAITDELGGGMFVANPATGKVSLINAMDAYEDGAVFTVTLKVAEDATPGDYANAVKVSFKASNAATEEVKGVVKNGSVDVTVEAEPCNHVWGEWVVVKEATETEKGLKERTCTLCGEKDQQEIPMLKPVAPVVPSDYVVVIAKAGENGEISPEGMIKVKVGGKEIFDIKANDGYVIEKLTVGGKEVTKAAGEAKYNLTVSNIVENMTVEATFAVATEAKPAPSTGANDFVGVAVALAVVSAMGAAVISKR